MHYSKQRELIKNIIKNRCDHPTADMVYLSAREVQPNISLATVYRNLKSLTDLQEVVTLETQDKRLHYDGDLSNHSHFICSKCGKIIDIFEPVAKPKAIEQLNLEVTEEKCFYYGLCCDCKVKN